MKKQNKKPLTHDDALQGIIIFGGTGSGKNSGDGIPPSKENPFIQIEIAHDNRDVLRAMREVQEQKNNHKQRKRALEAKRNRYHTKRKKSHANKDQL